MKNNKVIVDLEKKLTKGITEVMNTFPYDENSYLDVSNRRVLTVSIQFDYFPFENELEIAIEDVFRELDCKDDKVFKLEEKLCVTIGKVIKTHDYNGNTKFNITPKRSVTLKFNPNNIKKEIKNVVKEFFIKVKK